LRHDVRHLGKLAHGRTQRVIDLPGLGPADCQAKLVSTAGVKLGYTLKLSLAIEASG